MHPTCHMRIRIVRLPLRGAQYQEASRLVDMTIALSKACLVADASIVEQVARIAAVILIPTEPESLFHPWMVFFQLWPHTSTMELTYSRVLFVVLEFGARVRGNLGPPPHSMIPAHRLRHIRPR